MGKDKEKKEPEVKKDPEIEVVDYKDKWLRAVAEYDNLKKRVEREKTETVKYSTQFLIVELFPIMDSFDSAISSIENSKDKESFLKGLRMLQSEFHRVLEVNGLKKIKSVGEKFDPNRCEASEEVYTDKFPAGVIVEEIRGGYTLNDRLLRPALVKVSKGKEDSKDEEKLNPKS